MVHATASPKIQLMQEIKSTLRSQRKQIKCPSLNDLVDHLVIEDGKRDFEERVWTKGGIKDVVRQIETGSLFGRMKNIQYKKLAEERVADYLKALGFTQEEREKIYSRIRGICPDFEDVNSEIEHYKKLKNKKNKKREKKLIVVCSFFSFAFIAFHFIESNY
jgi:hypothetical protein